MQKLYEIFSFNSKQKLKLILYQYKQSEKKNLGEKYAYR